MDPSAEDFCVHHSLADFRIHFKDFKNHFMKVKGNLNRFLKVKNYLDTFFEGKKLIC